MQYFSAFSFLKTYCVWHLLFPDFKVEFSFFCFLPSEGWFSGLCKLHVGYELCLLSGGRRWVFFFPLMGRAVKDGNPVCWWLGLYFFLLFVVWIRHPAQVAAGSCVMPGLVYKWLPLWEFSLTDTPWVRSSPGVSGLAVSALTPKAPVLISGWRTEICYGIKWD